RGAPPHLGQRLPQQLLPRGPGSTGAPAATATTPGTPAGTTPSTPGTATPSAAVAPGNAPPTATSPLASATPLALAPRRRRPPPEDDPFDAPGFHAGSFIMKPAIELMAGYDTNPARLFT